jgi:glycosyltransferase involved in cell wall biosynthesis
MPLLREQIPGVELLLVGSHMPQEVAALAAKDVVAVGYVPSLDDIFGRIRLTIAPLRYGAGLKGKVLDSMAAGIPCVMTTIAAEGLNLPDELQSLVADEPSEIAERTGALCRDEDQYRHTVKAVRAYVEANYSSQRIDLLIREACGLPPDATAPVLLAKPIEHTMAVEDNGLS